MMRRQITRMVEDVIAVAKANLERRKPGSVDDICEAGRDDGRPSRRRWR